MKRFFLIIVILFVMLTGLIAGSTLYQNRVLNLPFDNKPSITINNQTFKLHIAKEPKDQETGLSKFDKLPQDFGMLFVFEKPGYYSFWMKNMKFPIDIIFIRNSQIVTIHKNVKPPTSTNENPLIYNSTQHADMVLEINSSLSEKYNFKVGDVVRLKGI